MKAKLPVFLLLLILLALMACTPSGDATEPAPEPTAAPQPSEAVLDARDAALNFLRETYGPEAPPAGLFWKAAYITPEGLVGGSDYEFTSDDWTIKVSYPIVLPEDTVYTVVVTNPATSFAWQGEVDPQGQVWEDGIPPAAEPPEEVWMALDAATTHIGAEYPDAPAATGLKWIVESVEPAEPRLGWSEYRFLGADWAITIGYPVVLPELTVYQVIALHTAGFRWQGEVDADGVVTESPDAADPSRPILSPARARDLVLSHIAETRNVQPSALDAGWTETDVSPEGLVGSTTLEYTMGIGLSPSLIQSSHPRRPSTL